MTTGQVLQRQVRSALRGPVHARWRGAQARWPALAGRLQSGPPDYVGIGVQRAGTSWWHSLIEAHPGVRPLGLGAKELHFFDPFFRGEFTATDAAAYHALFRRAPGQLVGEWTPRYLYDPWVPALLAQAAPQAKLLVMLRDPMDRFHSGLSHAVGRKGADLADAAGTAFARGLYGGQVQRLLRHVPRERLLVLQFERCRVEPERYLGATFGFLGLSEGEVDPTASRSHNALRTPRVEVSKSLLAEVAAAYADDLALLLECVPGALDPSLWGPGRAGG